MVCVRSQAEVKQFSAQSLQSDLNAEDDKAQVCPLKALNTITFTLASWGESESQAAAQIRQGSLKRARTHALSSTGRGSGRAIKVYIISSKQVAPCLGVKPSTVKPERIGSSKKKKKSMPPPQRGKRQSMISGGGGGGRESAAASQEVKEKPAGGKEAGRNPPLS